MNEVNQSIPAFPDNLVKLTASAAKWMGFAAYAWIISGAVTCLSIVGAIIGVPYIIIGLKLKKAAELLEEYISKGDQKTLEDFLTHVRQHFFIYSILVLIGLVIFVLYFMLVFYLIATKGTVTEVPTK